MSEKNVIKNKIGIVGMGPAGITAAIYLRRYGFDPVCFEKEKIGGKINVTHAIENYPGFIGSIQDLVDTFQAQMEKYKVNIVNEQVESISREEDGTFSVVTDANFYNFDAVLLATGLKERSYEVPNQKSYNGRGISRCATCDGPFFRNRDVAVLGGGNTALEEAIYLAGVVKHVYLIHRRNEFRGDQTLVDEFKALPNTTILTPYVIKDSKGENKIQHVTLENTQDQSLYELDIDGLFVYLGSSPVTEFVKIPDLFNDKGFIDANTVMETKIPGFFVAGDCRETPLRQIVTATSDGALASESIRKYVKSKK